MELRNRKITKRLFLRTIYKKTQFFGSVSSMKGGQKMDEQDLVGRERKCPVCGKVFILVDDEWAYKRVHGHKQMYFCSWGCMGKYDNTRPKKVAIDQREDLIRMLKEGKGVSEIVRTLGVDRSKVKYWKERVQAEITT